MRVPLSTIEIRYEDDIASVRQRAREVSCALGFEQMDQTRIATAVSEIARNAFNYAGGGRIEFLFEEDGKWNSSLVILVRDNGPGIRDLNRVLEGRAVSPGGLQGLGIVSARKLMDGFEIESRPGRGTTVVLTKRRSAGSLLTSDDLARLAKGLEKAWRPDPIEEVRHQNQELMRALEELRARQEELERLNRELEDTNRGVVALYAELDERASHLKRADELKSRFLSNMSHEFRTPLNSIGALTRLLLERVDGELTDEQEKQITFIQRNAQDLAELVNDLLDLAKVEAGRITVTPGEADVSNLFAALRGMFRPFFLNSSVKLIFEDPVDIPQLYTDGRKISQILRNFISNALKFTEAGEIRVSARFNPARQTVAFTVSDTGIGIAPEDQVRIFEEFTQLDNPIQKRVKGTGLGLPLSRKLAQLLGGSVYLESEPGRGSTFFAEIPRTYRGQTAGEREAAAPIITDPTRYSVLVVEDNTETVLLYEKYLRGTGFQIIAVPNVARARVAIRAIPRIAAIVLDVMLPGEGGLDFLTELKKNESTRRIPVIVISMMEESRKALALGAEDHAMKPVERRWLVDTLNRIARKDPIETVLVIDDDEVSCYLLKGFLADTRYCVIEARNGEEGLRLAAERRPSMIFLDLAMPGADGFEVLRRIDADARTRGTPVVIVTSKVLSDEEKRSLSSRAIAILSKDIKSRQDTMAQIREVLRAAAPKTPVLETAEPS